MAISDMVQAAAAKLDAYISKETAAEAEMAFLKQQVADLTAAKQAAESALAAAQAQASASSAAADQSAADLAAIQPLLDKINALPV